MALPLSLMHLALVLYAVILTLTGCSTITFAYNRADLLIKAYAKDYLDLEPFQVEAWEPLLTAELASHRAEELPFLAAYVDRVLRANQQGLDEHNMTCLIEASQDIYRRQALVVVTLASPLLAGLRPSQIKSLNQRFQEEAREDLTELAKDGGRTERERRIRRFLEAVEDWTGPLNSAQQDLVAEAVARMPETRRLFLDYRGGKRNALITLLEAKGEEAEIKNFLTNWLVDWADMPPKLEQARGPWNAQISELFIRLASSLDRSQHERLDKRLRNLRDDLLKLQKQPRMASLSC